VVTVELKKWFKTVNCQQVAGKASSLIKRNVDRNALQKSVENLADAYDSYDPKQYIQPSFKSKADYSNTTKYTMEKLLLSVFIFNCLNFIPN
jgi:hypothetical protein